MGRSLARRALFVAESVLLTLAVALAIQRFVAQPYRVEHESMLGTLQDGQMIIVDKLTPHVTGLSRGDIVLFMPPAAPGELDRTPYIKRIIGLPGDTVELRDGRVLVDGVPLDESAYTYRGEPTEPTGSRTDWRVPEGAVFVLGDHRSDSTDSRADGVGLVPMDRIVGRAVARYWPLASAALLTAPSYPELATAERPGQPSGRLTQASIARP